MKKYISILSLFAGAAFACAATSEDILAYKNSADSSAWYHELARQAYDPSARASAEKTLLEAMKNPGISDDAFRLSAKVMKYAGSEKSMQELLKLASSPNRTASVFDVLITAEYPSVDDLLVGALKGSKDDNVRVHAAYALGARKSAKAVQVLHEAAKGASPALSNACVTALGHIPSDNSVKALADIARGGKADPFLVNYALSEQREALVNAGRFKEAQAVAVSPEFVPGLLSFAASRPDASARMAFLDKNILDSELPGRHAARIANAGRTFENSAALVKAYPGLDDGAKIAAIRSFALSGDKRFYDVIKGEVSDSKSPVNMEAVFACAYIGTDDAIPTLEALLGSSSGGMRFAAEYALTTMPGAKVGELLNASYAKTKSAKLMDILLNRGDAAMKDELFRRMFDAADEDRAAIVKIFENQVGYGGLERAIKEMQKVGDRVRKDTLGALIRFVMKDNNKKFRMQIYRDYFENSGLTAAELEIVQNRLNPQKKK